MTRVTWYEQRDEISVTVSGHAGYDKIGFDIVCASISTLATTLLSYLNVDNDDFKYSMKEGHIWAYAKGKNVRTALHVIMTGFHLLEESYPDNVVIIRGCCLQRYPQVID